MIDGDLYPRPGAVPDLLSSWRSGVAQIVGAANETRSGIQSARGGGASINGLQGAIEQEKGAVGEAVRTGDPNAELGQVAGAVGNVPGVDQNIRGAEVRAADPRADVPGVDTSSGTGWIGGNTNEVRNRGNEINRQSGPGDNFERNALEGKRG